MSDCCYTIFGITFAIQTSLIAFGSHENCYTIFGITSAIQTSLIAFGSHENCYTIFGITSAIQTSLIAFGSHENWIFLEDKLQVESGCYWQKLIFKIFRSA